MLLFRFLAATALLSGASIAQEPAPGGAPSPEVAEPITVTGEIPQPEPKLVCKYSSTGTMLRKRVCKPQAEWAKAEQDSEQQMKDLRDWQRVRCNYGMSC